MTTLVIPTRNRPRSLSLVLEFVERFYPATRVVIADGSSPDFQKAAAARVSAFNGLAIDFLPYPASLSLFDRLLDTLRQVPDEFVIMGADDDFPLISTLEQGRPFLEAHREYALAAGTMLVIEERNPGKLSAIIRPCRPIAEQKAAARIRHYAEWPVPLSYGLCRRQTLIDRFTNTKLCPMGEVYDLLAGVFDCISGKVHAIPDISVVLTRNHAQTYWRAASRLEFLDQGPQLASMIRNFAGTLHGLGELESRAAEELATRIFLRHIGTYFLGLPYASQPRFIDGGLHRLEIVGAQFSLFDRIFTPATAEHDAMRERLAFIVTALAANSAPETPDQGEIEAAVSHFRDTIAAFSTSFGGRTAQATAEAESCAHGADSMPTRIDTWAEIDPLTLQFVKKPT